ncbi:MAG TPA: serine hydrolase domain-containing protein [Vicinamibacterales bacterium]|nr:serine hydrolase domain-containing protein [Vicinamibacterales bacterium]HPW21152.1 serine hydrolase domain-containing protein [Vicinamibacterales bacterium]
MRRRPCFGAVVLALALVLWPARARPSQAAQQPPITEPAPGAIDRIFAPVDRTSSPGCAVGVASRGRLVHLQGYGMANLEYGVPIRPLTVFEAGSVAKQVTAAAVVLLAQDGKLSLDDPVRTHVPELPEFGAPILVRHLLGHTSGLRSQWPMLTMAGRPPGLAVHSVAEILELAGRYRELNFKPGDEFLYNNTGYTLLGVIVARASGTSLEAFCQERLFRPLGMTRTRWREDFSAVVEGRATAYLQLPNGEHRTYMPFTNVIGNGGLLTTVGDLLLWNENLDHPRVGGQAMVDLLQTKGRLNDGSETEYGLGLYVQDYRGVREVSHGGTTAGYRAYLGRFPDDGLSVGILCNTLAADPSAYAHQIADLMLGPRLKKIPVARKADVPDVVLQRMAGYYLEKPTDLLLRLEWEPSARSLKIGGQLLVPVGDGELLSSDGSRRFSTGVGWSEGLPASRIVEKRGTGKHRTWDLQGPFRPKPEALAAYAGDYVSEELDTRYLIAVAGNALELRFRPAQRAVLTPACTDVFDKGGDTVRFTRGASGNVDGLLITTERARRVKFVRQ